jgi:RimJ/RimL family protein N-acetyltransferase
VSHNTVECSMQSSAGNQVMDERGEGVSVVAETLRLRLRRFTANDLEHLIALHTDPEVMRHVDDGGATRDDLRDDYLPAYLRYYELGDAYGFWVGEDRITGEFLGWWHLRPRPGAPAEEPELGYSLARAAGGRGLATEASRALVSRGFREHGVRRLVASAAEANIASWKVMENLGMRRTGLDDGEVHYALELTLTGAASASSATAPAPTRPSATFRCPEGSRPPWSSPSRTPGSRSRP